MSIITTQLECTNTEHEHRVVGSKIICDERATYWYRTPGEVEGAYIDIAQQDIARVALALRRMADNIERDITDQKLIEQPLNTVSTLISDVSWGIANLNLGALVSSAERILNGRIMDEERNKK